MILFGSKPKLYVMIGSPASGKTTFAKTLKALRVCPDDIRVELKDTNSGRAFAEARRRIEFLIAQGVDVVFDATHSKRWERESSIMPFKGKARIIGVWMQTSLPECIRRHGQRRFQDETKDFDFSVIDRMAANLHVEPPYEDSWFDELWEIPSDWNKKLAS